MVALAEGGIAREATMRDVAALAGVSLKTVSRVVNRERGVSAPLVERVLEAQRRLDYAHNQTASTLRRGDGRTASIGLLLEDVANPFSSAVHRAVEDVAAARSTLVFAGSSDEDAQRERSVLAAFASRRVDGLIVVPVTDEHRAWLHGRRRGRPLVFLDRPAGLPSDGAAADSVTTDNREATRSAVGALLARGHARVAYLGDLQSIWTADQRYRGYLDAFASARRPVDPAIVRHGVRGVEHAEEAAVRMLTAAAPPTALFTAQNLVTIGAVRALRRLRLQHRVALLGFDDFALADLLEPAVSVVRQDPTALGRAAALLLFARLEGDRSPPRHLVLPSVLVARGSGEVPPPHLPLGAAAGAE